MSLFGFKNWKGVNYKQPANAFSTDQNGVSVNNKHEI